MNQLSERHRPSGNILPDGVVRAKDNTEDFIDTPKSQREEAEHNMGYYLVELNHRNSELETSIQEKNVIIRQLRKEIDLLHRNMKVVADAPLPQLQGDRLTVQGLQQKYDASQDELRMLRETYSVVAQQRNDARAESRLLSARLSLQEEGHKKFIETTHKLAQGTPDCAKTCKRVTRMHKLIRTGEAIICAAIALFVIARMTGRI